MKMRETAGKERVCVTGAGGFLGSWLVKLLLQNGYMVHGIVRNPSDKKNAHLKKLENAAENLQLFKADLLDFNDVCAAVAGCKGVFHVASPVPSGRVENPEIEVITPAVEGTANVLRACSIAKVKRVVFVSSIVAVTFNPSWPKDKIMDESCWSDKEYCLRTENWYCLSKTEAESKALDYAKTNALDVISVCPAVILGPVLQSTVNTSSLVLLKILKDGVDTVENKVHSIVDVRDVAEALLLVYKTPEAKERYICAPHMIKVRDLVGKLRGTYPIFNYPKNFIEVDAEARLSSEKLMKLGWKYRPLEETLVDSVESYQASGFLSKG